MKNTLGVVVGRFQVPELHDGHKFLLAQVQKKHEKVLICLGTAPIRLSQSDPLDYATRCRMLQSALPSATIVPLEDHPSDQTWSENLDRLINVVFPTNQATLYCSRNSFKTAYSGKWPVIELESKDAVPTGTLLRQQGADTVIDSAEFRSGVIYGTANRFPISYQVIDVAVLQRDQSKTEVLVCRKNYDHGWRFIGGFVDPTDPNLEATVKREVREETGVSLTNDDPVYLGSYRIEDWRYRNGQDKVLTAFFAVDYMFGHAKAQDDIAEAKWLPLIDSEDRPFVENFIPEHQALASRLLEYHTKIKKGGRV